MEPRDVFAIRLERFMGVMRAVSVSKIDERFLHSLPKATGLVVYDPVSFRLLPWVPVGFDGDEIAVSASKDYYYDAAEEIWKRWDKAPVGGWSVRMRYDKAAVIVSFLDENRRPTDVSGEAAFITASEGEPTDPIQVQGLNTTIPLPGVPVRGIFLILDGDTAGTIFNLENRLYEQHSPIQGSREASPQAP